MSRTRAIAALLAAGIPFTPHDIEHDPGTSAFGAEAVQALAVDPGRIFKTLMADVDGTLSVAIVPVSGTLDLKALAGALGGRKATMADPVRAERRTGYVVGGISPLGQKHPHRTVLDISAQTWDTVFVSGGRRGFEIELEPASLTAATNALIAAIARR